MVPRPKKTGKRLVTSAENAFIQGEENSLQKPREPGLSEGVIYLEEMASGPPVVEK